MDRDEALTLLRGGPEGIAEWNRRRSADEEIPDLIGADLIGAHLAGAHLAGAHLGEADLRVAHLGGADLRGANLSGANLIRTDLGGANLRGANLIGANLMKANLSRANLIGADLAVANLGDADLGGANLIGADLGGAIMVRVDLRGAKLRDCRIFGISAWDIKTDEDTEQINLIISDDDEPITTVDNLKVAQFLYLLLNNEEIREVIDTITSKVVLILGRFTPERKALLDAIREALRRRDYLPVMFDFEKPRSRSYTETITTLARMARFIVADSTDATELRAELAKIVPNLPSVPVQPLVLASETEYETFKDIRRYPWVLEPFRYEDPAHAISSLPEMVFTPAEAKVTELRG